MQNKVFRNVLLLMFFCAANFSFCSTNSTCLSVSGNKSKDCDKDPLLQRSAKIRQMDAEGLSEYESERESELKKIITMSGANITPAPTTQKITDYLLKMPCSEKSCATTNDIPAGDKEIRKRLMLERIVPLWTGTNWIDGTVLANNGFNVSRKGEELLASLNYFDAVSRYFSGPNGDLLGGARSQIQAARMSLLFLNYEVKYDKTFGIWRITGTNAPAAKSP